MELFRRYIPTASPTVFFRWQIPTAFETELVMSLKITDGKYPSVIPLVLSDFLVVCVWYCSSFNSYYLKKVN
jgi:hypothetical protein